MRPAVSAIAKIIEEQKNLESHQRRKGAPVNTLQDSMVYAYDQIVRIVEPFMFHSSPKGAILTDATLRDLLRPGYETGDADFVGHMVGHMSRTVYLMVQFLTEHKYRFISSVDLQRRVVGQLRTSDIRPTSKFNPVDWFSEQWFLVLEGRATTKYLGMNISIYSTENAVLPQAAANATGRTE